MHHFNSILEMTVIKFFKLQCQSETEFMNYFEQKIGEKKGFLNTESDLEHSDSPPASK